MATYTLPREAFGLLEEAFGDRKKAEIFAKAMETAISAIDDKAKEAIVDKKEYLKVELKEELKNELVTREIFDERLKGISIEMNERFKSNSIEMNERFKVVDERFKSLTTEMNERFKVVDERFNGVEERFRSLNFRLNIFIAIALIALTFANPTFIKLLEKLFKF